MSNNKNREIKITYSNHRAIWNSDAFIKKTLSLSDNTNMKDSSSARLFRRQLAKIPIQKSYTIVGYGSLMNEQDVPRTMPNATDHRLGILSGYERIFNTGYYKTSFLNVRRSKNPLNEMNVALVDIPYEDLPELIARERNYDFIEVEVYDVLMEENIVALMVISSNTTNDALTPQLNYLHLCLTGVNYMNGLSGVKNFLNTTYCYSNKSHDHVLIKDWLKEVDLIDYMFMNNYNPR